MKVLEVKILDKFDQIKTLRYRLYDTPLTLKWAELTKLNLSDPTHKVVSIFSNRTKKDVPEITESINDIVRKINQLYDRHVKLFDLLDVEKLNYLHQEFEIFGERIETLMSLNLYSEELANLFFSLNEHIHMCENAMASEPYRWGGFGIQYDIHPLGKHLPIEDQDKLLLEPFFTWGRLYLGYNTLGKDWMDVAQTNDIRVVEEHAVKPQQRFAAEAWMNFIVDQEKNIRVAFFLNWVKSLPPELQNRVPFNNLNNLTLGRFPLGNIIIDHEFLKVDSNINNWKIYRHPCKLKWIHEVLTTYRTIEEIKILES